MDRDLLGSGYRSQKGTVSAGGKDSGDGAAGPQWGAMFHPVLGQVWLSTQVEDSPDLEQILLEESMHVQETLNRPAHLLPLRRYLQRRPGLPGADHFRDIVECHYVALTPLLLRRPITTDSLPAAPTEDREAAERILALAERLAQQEVAGLTIEQRRRFALSALTTVASAALPREPGSLGRVLDHLADAVERIEWSRRFELESLLIKAAKLPVRGSLWPSRWRGDCQLALDRSLLTPSEVMLVNALHAAQLVISDPQSVLPVLPSLNAVLSRRNDVPIVLVRKHGGEVTFDILEHQQRIAAQELPVEEELPECETDEDLSPADEAWFRFDDHYFDYLETRGRELRVGDFTMAALHGLKAVARDGLGELAEEARFTAPSQDRQVFCKRSSQFQNLTDHMLATVGSVVRGYADWLDQDGLMWPSMGLKSDHD